MTFEEWRELSEPEQERIHFQEWDVLNGEGKEIALAVGREFQNNCTYKVHAVNALNRFGEWIIELIVDYEDFENLKRRPQSSYLGFRILWGNIRNEI